MGGDAHADCLDAEQASKFGKNVTVIDDVDCTKEDCGDKVVAGLKGAKVDLALYVSGVVVPEVSASL